MRSMVPLPVPGRIQVARPDPVAECNARRDFSKTEEPSTAAGDTLSWENAGLASPSTMLRMVPLPVPGRI